MKTLELKIEIGFCSVDELKEADRELVEAARQATANSYSPYSHFSVGADLRLSDGEIIIGANQENAAFPSGLCAERTAMFAAQAQCPSQSVVALAIAAQNNGVPTARPVAPCGACRQSLIEIEERYKRPMKVLLCGTEGVYIVNSVKDLLPLSFIGDSMIETL